MTDYVPPNWPNHEWTDLGGVSVRQTLKGRGENSRVEFCGDDGDGDKCNFRFAGIHKVCIKCGCVTWRRDPREKFLSGKRSR